MARLGQRKGASSTSKKFFIEHTFQRRDLRANGGLGDVQFLRRFPQSAFFGDDPKVSQMMVIQEIHLGSVFALT